MCLLSSPHPQFTGKVPTLSAVLAVPAAVRLPRSAAARRALLTTLLLGGFLTLAFLFGGTAHAASGTDDPGRKSSEASALVKSGKSSGAEHDEQADEKKKAAAYKAALAEHRREAQRAAEKTASQVIEPVKEGAAGAGQVTRPVGETVDGVADTVDLRGLSERLGLQIGDAGEDVPGDGSGGVPGHDSGSATGAADGAGYGPEGERAQAGPDGARGLTSHAAVHNSAAGDAGSRGDGGPSDRLPFQQAPSAPASSTSQYAGDGNGPRGGGPFKLAGHVTGDQCSGLLQPGAVSAAAGTPTRDRAAEILEFPG